MKDLLPMDTLLQILCYPWIELKYELNALFIENRHTTRSAVRICSIVLTTCVGLFLFFNNVAIVEFFRGIIQALSFIPEPLQYKASISLNALAFGSIGAYSSKAIIRGICKYKFGDPDFFLTDKRTIELIDIFTAQELEIDAPLLKEVVHFCVHNLRAHCNSTTIGARKQDWEQILNAIIYEADIDLFLEQQRALQYSHKSILDKKSVINTYKQLARKEAITSIQTYTQTPSTTIEKTDATTNITPTHRHSPTRLTCCSLAAVQQADETTPLLTKQPRQDSTSADSHSSRESYIAKRVITQFKQIPQTRTRLCYIASEEQLADQCSQHLENQALITHQHILYSHGIQKIARQNEILSSTIANDADYTADNVENTAEPPIISPSNRRHRNRASLTSEPNTPGIKTLNSVFGSETPSTPKPTAQGRSIVINTI